MAMKQYVESKFTEAFKKYGMSEEDIKLKAEDFVYQILDGYSGDELPLDLREMLDERIPYIIQLEEENNLFRYPMHDDSGELTAILVTFKTRAEVTASLEAFRFGSDKEFQEFMLEDGIVVVGGFEPSIEWM